MEEQLKSLYYSPDKGFLSQQKLYKKAKEEGIKVTHATVKKFLESQETWQLTKQQKLPSVYNSYYALRNGQEMQGDVVIYDRYRYGHYQYILCVMDIHSRKVACRALTSKNLQGYIKAFQDIIKRDFGGVYPDRWTSDNEFAMPAFIKMLKDNGVKDIDFSDPSEIHKQPCIERWNRTLASRLQKWRIASRSHNWPKALPDIVKSYNTSYHSTIRQSPDDVWNGVKPSKQVIRVVETTFEVGQKVRYRLKKPRLFKGDRLTFSKDVYIIKEKVGNKFVLMSANGTVQKEKRREYELVRADQTELAPEKEEAKLEDLAPRKKVKSDVQQENILTEKRVRKPKQVHDV